MVNALDFSLEEYKALREEILTKMDSCIKILSLGVGGISVIFGFIYESEAYYLFFVLPFLIFANLYIYKAETKSIINAGEYICRLKTHFTEKTLIPLDVILAKLLGIWAGKNAYEMEKRLSYM
jgi:hypothetical protein